MSSLNSRLNASSPDINDSRTGADTLAPSPSIFGIIVVGLLAGLVTGLLAGPNFTVQGFFLGFAGGALITAGVYFYSAQRNSPPR